MNMEANEFYVNPFQQRLHALNPHRAFVISSRATGKSANMQALRSIRLMRSMPQSLGGLVGSSYAQIVERVFPALLQGFSDFGLVKNRDYMVGKFNPKWKLPLHRYPEDATHFVHFSNGTGLQLVSQDRTGLANGLEFAWVIGDEARFLNYDRLQEFLLTLRGARNYFGKCEGYLSQMWTTDMPTNTSEEWLFRYEKQKMSKERETAILSSEYLRSVAFGKREKYKIGSPLWQKYNKEYVGLEKLLYELRKNTVYFGGATTLDNVFAIGTEAITNMENSLSQHKFRVGVLNLRERRTEKGFYPKFDSSKHTFLANNYTYIDNSRSTVRTWRWDSALNPEKILEIGADYGSSINCAVVGQRFGTDIVIHNSFYVKTPEGVPELVKKIGDYYAGYPNKRIRFFYDHTAHYKGKDNKFSYYSEWLSELRKAGWVVEDVYLGQTATHHSRFLVWDRIFGGSDKYTVRINRDSCQNLIKAIQFTEAVDGENGFKKNKKTERDSNYEQEYAPHATDAADMLLLGMMSTVTEYDYDASEFLL